jgi:hypothetical protein
MTNHPIRPERSFEHYSRGAELVRAIRALWEANKALSPGQSGLISQRIEALMTEFDLTFGEWYYWSRQVQALRAATHVQTAIIDE